MVEDVTDDTVGAVVSMVTDSAGEAVDTLPALSVALAVMLWVPVVRVETVME